MTFQRRYNDEKRVGLPAQGGYMQGVDRVLTYIESIQAYPLLVKELNWAIKEGII